MVKRTFVLRSVTEVEELLHEKLTIDNVEKFIGVEGLEHLKVSLNKGNGVILAIAHFGAYHQVMPALGLRGYKVNQVANEVKTALNQGGAGKSKVSNYWAEKVFRTRLRYSGDRLPANIIHVGGDNPIAPLFRCLRNNEVLVMALDGREVGKLAMFSFLHSKAYWFATGPVNLALRTGAPIHPIFVLRQKNKRNKLIIKKPIHIEKELDRAETIVRNTAKIIKALEDYVEKYPCHYGMEILFEKRRLASLKQVSSVSPL